MEIKSNNFEWQDIVLSFFKKAKQDETIIIEYNNSNAYNSFKISEVDELDLYKDSFLIVFYDEKQILVNWSNVNRLTKYKLE